MASSGLSGIRFKLEHRLKMEEKRRMLSLETVMEDFQPIA